MLPNRHNWCGGNYGDWMEVLLTDKCNGNCSWCIEKEGFHPEYRVDVWKIANKIIESEAKNIVLLGGEPTLYKDLQKLIEIISGQKHIYITTNGSLVTDEVIENLYQLSGINISIHHYDLGKNEEITNIYLNQETLENAIARCRFHDITVRFNCNAIDGYIDSEEEIMNYIKWAKETGVDRIRFAELKHDGDNFVDLGKILNYKYGLNDNPYIEGCNKDVMINDMAVNFRQMCGLQTDKRVKPINPKSPFKKQVLYYDGKIYNGWQREVNNMTDNEIRKIIKEEMKLILKELKKDKKEASERQPDPTPEEVEETKVDYDNGGNCVY